MGKLTKIRIETDSLMVLKGRASMHAWCPQCQTEGEMLPLEGIAIVTNLARSETQEWIESDELHHVESQDGGVLICLNSMLKRMQSTRTT